MLTVPQIAQVDHAIPGERDPTRATLVGITSGKRLVQVHVGPSMLMCVYSPIQGPG